MRALLGYLARRVWPAKKKPGLDLAALLRPYRHTAEQWWQAGNRPQPLYVDLSAKALDHLRGRLPELVAAASARADAFLRHEFNMLGSGPFTPVDPDRRAHADGYRPIDWYLDPVQNLRFPQGIHYQQWELYSMRPGTADIKLPWELARCQHWATLGQAWRLSGDERCAREIVHQLDDFVEANPVGSGIHWTCTMDVALRALNWAIGLELIRTCSSIPEAFWVRAYQALFEHGLFIFNNFENHCEITSNHFLSNIVGLYYLAAVFDDIPQAKVWSDFCRRAIDEEMHKQVLDDGADFESSVPYHRLVTELFLGAARVAERCGQPFPAGYLQRLRTMIEYLLGVMRPDGLMPQAGDADDGRLHILTQPWQPQDARHLLGPAALLLEEPAWLDHAGPTGLWETAWWGYDIDGLETSSEPPRPVCRLYPQAGSAAIRRDGTYLLITNGIVGTRGFGNHKHNDLLGFEFHAQGAALLVDPGSYVYTSDAESRNLFRSTTYHNTLRIDRTEQNDLKPEWLFRLMETAKPEHVEFCDHGREVHYRGRHTGYQRLSQSVTHERHFQLDAHAGFLVIHDRLSGTGPHALHWHFHAAPDVRISRIDDRTFTLEAGPVRYQLTVPAGLTAEIKAAWYSPSYGVRVPCQVLDLHAQVALARHMEWTFTLAPLSVLKDSVSRGS